MKQQGTIKLHLFDEVLAKAHIARTWQACKSQGRATAVPAIFWCSHPETRRGSPCKAPDIVVRTLSKPGQLHVEVKRPHPIDKPYRRLWSDASYGCCCAYSRSFFPASRAGRISIRREVLEKKVIFSNRHWFRANKFSGVAAHYLPKLPR